MGRLSSAQAPPLERLTVKVKVRRNVGMDGLTGGGVTSNYSGSASLRLN